MDARPLEDTPAATFAWLLAAGFKPIAVYAPGMERDHAKPDALTQGKEPMGSRWGLRDWTLEDFRRADHRCRQEVNRGAGVGVCLGPGRGPGRTWLIDVEGDGPEAETSRAKLFGGEVIETMGWGSRRGHHRLFLADVDQLAAIMPGLKPFEGKGERAGVYKSDVHLPGLELRLGGFKPDGQVKQVQSVVPPTCGVDGAPRIWAGPMEVATVPATFYATLAGLVAPPAPAQPDASSKAPTPPMLPRQGGQLTAEERAAAYLAKCDPAISGQSGHDKAFKAACKVGPGFDLAPDVAFRLLLADFNPRCEPPWTEADLRHKVEDAYRVEVRRGWLLDANQGRKGPSPRLGVYRPHADQGDDQKSSVDQIKIEAGTHEELDCVLGVIGPNEVAEDPHRLARIYLDASHRHPEHVTLVFHDGEFSRWDTAYRPMPIPGIRAVLTTAVKAEFDRINLDEIADWEASGEKGKKPTVTRVTTSLVNNVVQALGAETLLDDRYTAPCWISVPGNWPAVEILPTRNALVHLPSFAEGIEPYCLPPTPRFFCPYATDYNFDPTVEAPSHWLEFLERLWPDDHESVASLQEWFGYHLTPDISQEKIAMLIGPRRSGKGTIAKVLTAMIGDANVCNPKFGALGLPFGTESLIGKMAAIITDARITSRTDIAQVVENLLTISGSDRQTIARKYKTDWSGNLTTKFTIISNELPRLADASGALPGRLIVFRLEESFYGKEDTKLFSAKIRPEMPGILLWAIEGWKRLRDRGRLHQPVSGQQLVDEMEELSSPISLFLNDRCVVEPGREVLTTELFNAWVAWCEIMGNKNPGDQIALGRNLRSVLPSLVTKQFRHGNERFRRYVGLDLISPTPF